MHSLSVLVPLVLALSGQLDQKEQARQFLDLCQAGKFAEATSNFDAKMKEVLGPDKLEGALEAARSAAWPHREDGTAADRQGRRARPG